MFDLFIIRYNHAFKIIQGILFKTILIKYLKTLIKKTKKLKHGKYNLLKKIVINIILNNKRKPSHKTRNKNINV